MTFHTSIWIALSLICGPLPESAKLPSGHSAPRWSNLKGTDGKRHSLADFDDKAAVVVVFFSVNCPDSIEYEHRLVEFARECASKSVGFLFINVSLLPEDNLERMTARAVKQHYSFQYVIDPTQKLGLAYAVRNTPTVFVLDKGRKVAYRGAFDDSERPQDVSKHYARDSLAAVLAGRKVAVPETEAPGCTLEYELLDAK